LAVLPIAVAWLHGVSVETDSFFLAYAAVTFVANTFAPLLETAAVPFFAAAVQDGRRVEIRRGLLFGVTRGSVAGVAALYSAAALWRIVGNQHVGTTGPSVHLAILTMAPVANAIGAVFIAELHAQSRFYTVATVTSMRGLVPLASGMLLSRELGIAAFSVGILCGELVATLGLRVAVGGTRGPSVVRDIELPEFWRVYFSLLVGGAANSSRPFVDRMVAGSLGPGAVTILEIAERLFLAGASLFGAPFATVMLSRWSTLVVTSVQGNRGRLEREMRDARRVCAKAAAISLAAMLLLYVPGTSESIFGGFGVEEAETGRTVLAMYVLGTAPYLLTLAGTQILIVLREARFIAALAVVLAATNVPLDIVAATIAGLPGVAVVTTLLNVAGWLACEARVRTRLRIMHSEPHDVEARRG
jgi:peptidoglycan biosynthesis protein MviN/MurJ (putative lipid II flippase)